MEHYQVILAYDGTEFRGFQLQARGRTVQGVVEQALRQVGWQEEHILAAGRTDTGVHATGQVIAFDLAWKHSLSDLCCALNASLPADVVVRTVRVAPQGFHPRRHARSRCYRYSIYFQKERDPLRERYAWRVWPTLDISALHLAAQALVGRHDFRAFGSPPRPESSTVRTVFRAHWEQDESGVTFEIAADAFLYHMVRRIVALQVMIGQGRCLLSALHEYLALQADPLLVQYLAPAHGLVLTEVIYPQDMVFIGE